MPNSSSFLGFVFVCVIPNSAYFSFESVLGLGGGPKESVRNRGNIFAFPSSLYILLVPVHFSFCDLPFLYCVFVQDLDNLRSQKIRKKKKP